MTGAWLGIETTGRTGGAALVDGRGAVLAEVVLELRSTCSVSLLPAIAALLSEAGLAGGDLAGIAVSTGPGSYTGVRIGIATAAGLSAGWGARIKGVPTLRVIAWQSGAPGRVLAAVRARRGEVFAAVFESPDPLSGVVLEPGTYLAASLRPLVSSLAVSACAGSGVEEIRPDAVSTAPDQPSPSSVAILGGLLSSRQGFDGVPAPLYLRGFHEEAGPVAP